MWSGRHNLMLAAALLVAACFASGAEEGDCLPDMVNVVCVEDSDCLARQMCNPFGGCIPSRVTIETDAVWYAPGTPVVFTVDTHGLEIEVPEGPAGGPWSIEHWSSDAREWIPLRIAPPQGCRTTGCFDGQAIVLCTDPSPSRCVERCSPFEGEWDGYHWVTTEVPCGDDTIGIDERIVATPGNYIVRYRFALDPHPGVTMGGRCTPAETDTVRPFGIR